MTPIRKGGGANPAEIFGEGAFKQRVYIGTDLVWQKNPDAGVFIFTHDGTQYRLQTNVGGTYDFVVDWGDGTTDTITAWDQTEVTHSYSGSGPWEVRVSGVFDGITSNSLSQAHCLEIKNWGCVRPTVGYWFSGHTRMTVTATDLLDLTISTSMAHIFKNCHELVSLPSGDQWVMPNGTGHMGEAFRYCYKFTGVGIGSWDTSTCNSLAYTFQNCYALNESINSWDVSNVITMVYAFYGCGIYDQPMNSWDTAKVVSLFGTFFNCTAFNQSLNSWNTSNITSLAYTFYNCQAFNGNISSWNTAKNKTLASTFYGCSEFDQNISLWNVSLVTSMVYTFRGCVKFNQDISGWNTSSATNMMGVLWGATLFNQSVGSWNTTKVTTFYGALYNTSFAGSLAGWNIEAVTQAGAFYNLLFGTAMTTTNYDATLNSWAGQIIPAIINQAHFGGSKYSPAGAASRTYLVDTEGWAISDGGPV